MNNKVFYQHPNLMRVLGMHETVMEVMVNVLGGDKSQVLDFFRNIDRGFTLFSPCGEYFIKLPLMFPHTVLHRF